ncbi:MAG: hypothetical protein IKQ15_01580 [Kiritimatiellae bacterium]|nr:hypothetical protein [Kiritimatiellia bacterium]
MNIIPRHSPPRPPAPRPFSGGREKFPMIGKLFSNGWKIHPGFPTIGKIFRRFSNDWKIFFHSLENVPAGARRGFWVFHSRANR